MSTKDNANPIVHRPAGHAAAKSALAPTSTEDWWRDEAIHLPDTSYSNKQGIAALDEGDGDGMDEDEVKEKREEIDANEVFGEYALCDRLLG
jgi:hypothetical protein